MANDKYVSISGTLHELCEAYKKVKANLDKAKKAEERVKADVKAAMLAENVPKFTDAEGFKFERIEQQRNKLDEDKLLRSLNARGLTDCIKLVEAVDTDEVLIAIEEGRLPQWVLAECLTTSTVVMLKLTDTNRGKK